MPIDDIVVTAQLGFDIYLPYYNPVFDIYAGFGNYNLADGSTVAYAQALSAYSDIVVIATTKTPNVRIAGADAGQTAVILQILDHLDQYPDIAEAAQKAHDKNVMIEFHIKNTLSTENPADYADIQFTPYYENGPNNDPTFQPSSSIVINIYAPALDPAAPGGSFEEAITHEMAHLVVDSANHEFITDNYGGVEPGKLYVQDIEAAVHAALLDGFVAANYMDSRNLDISAKPGYPNDVILTGTAGNNVMDHGDGFSDRFYSGNGNDVILSKDADDYIIINGTGRKYISEGGYGFDNLRWELLPTVTDAVYSIIGYNIYITVSGSSYAPIDDPNAIIILQAPFFPAGIEFVSASDDTATGFPTDFPPSLARGDGSPVAPSDSQEIDWSDPFVMNLMSSHDLVDLAGYSETLHSISAEISAKLGGQAFYASYHYAAALPTPLIDTDMSTQPAMTEVYPIG